MSENIEDAAKEYAEINEDKAANSAHSYSKYDIADAYQQGYNLAVSRLKKEFNKNKNKMKTVKFNLRMKGETAEADIKGSPAELVELIATIMNVNDVCARLIMAATEVYKLQKSKEDE